MHHSFLTRMPSLTPKAWFGDACLDKLISNIIGQIIINGKKVILKARAVHSTKFWPFGNHKSVTRKHPNHIKLELF